MPVLLGLWVPLALSGEPLAPPYEPLEVVDSMTRARKGRAPVPGASRCYVLTPSETEDAFMWAADRMRARGWTPIEQDYRLGVADPTWIMVELWAIPPAA